MIEIHAARPEDGPGILEIVSRIDIFNSAEKACVQELWNDYLDKQDASEYHFLVCHDSGRVVGFACYGLHPLTKSAYDLHWIAVHPEMQAHGLGRALLACVEAGVRVGGGTLLLIETSGKPNYQATRRFYEACGYERQAVIHDFYASGDDLVLFAKYLNGKLATVPVAQQAT